MKDRCERPDAIDRAAGIAPEDPLFRLREQRAEFVVGAAACQAAVLAPREDLGLDPDLRSAIARRVARMSGNPVLVAEYPLPQSKALHALADGGEVHDPGLSAIARYADCIAWTPGAATKSHLEDLIASGLSTPQIVALSELLAFVCFQAQVAHGLSLLTEMD